MDKKKPNSKTVKKTAKSSKVKAAGNDMPLISEEEWKTRELRHQQRLQDIRVCLGFITESITDYKDLLVEQSHSTHWNRYLACDGLPRVQYPPEIRSMIAEMRHFEAKHVESVVNWALSVDEQSVLSQDIFRTDLTRKTLEQNLRPNIGRIYDEYVQRILTTLDRIELLLASDYDMTDLPADRALEITSLRSELNQEIDVIFDKLTYRIVCAPTSYRTAFDGVTETYCYESPNFNYQLWWLSDVPIRFQYLELPLMLADLNCVGIKIQIPMSVLGDNLTLRCIHTFFDPYSESAKSYEQVIDRVTDNFNGGMMDIEDCLINEWLMQVNIMENAITQVETKLIEYEEYLREMELRAAASKTKETDKNKNKNKRSSKQVTPKIKVLKEPEQLPEGMFPDPRNAFLEQEQREFEEFLDEFLNPANMHLKPYEINLRRYCILGGLYSMIFVQKPKHTDFQKFNVTLHEDGRILRTLEELRADVDEDGEEGNYMAGSRAASVRFTSTSSHKIRMNLAQEDPTTEQFQLNADELPYFCMTFKLPEHLCRFGQPLACQFIEEEIEEDEPENLLTVELEEHRNKKKRSLRKINPALTIVKAPTAAEGKEKIRNASRKTVRRSLDIMSYLPRPRQSNIIPKTPQPKNLYRRSVLSMLRLSSLRTTILPGVHFRNFPITGGPLTNMQARDLQRHCLPRILSSFKFPTEFRSDRTEELAERGARGCILIRRHLADTTKYEEEEQPEYFSFEKQEAPERLYPVFDWRERLLLEESSSSDTSSLTEGAFKIKFVKVDQIGDVVKADDPEKQTIYGVINTLQEIQDKYKAHSKKITEQPNFIVKAIPLTRANTTLEVPESAQTSRPKSTVHISMVGASKLIPSAKSTRQSHARTSGDASQRLGVDMDSEIISINSGVAFHPNMRNSKLGSYDDDKDSHKELPKVKHWTTKYINRTVFEPETLTIKIQTDRLGIFGFAYKRYEQFPFRNWTLQYNEEDINEIVFKLDTFHVSIYLFITNAGIRGYVTKMTTEYTARPVKYLEIKEPISDYRELRRRFCEKNINIFAEHDACYYIENGYFSEKHLATELHVYDAFAIHCKLMKFYRCDWNRLATRRNIVLCLRNPKDLNDGADVTVRVTPDNSTFVEISEACSDNLDVIKLDYQPTWRNIGVYSDLHQLINSMYPQATDVRNRDPKLIYYIRTLFTEVRPLSFS
ncbi:uncharacterized protein [Drosophila virilis]|uniref:Uncharacterized protein, isoform A n=1 Tax=Drosophila virilis TaxID=7244 RepID=B4LB73_DROVI|nr:uncharacterized protein LOC6624057 isoform X1 [Drosophila virilis]EDW68637.2 uncharacterized protein Dvir_GJ12586, isoform A [Drosophila virilis]